MSEYFMHGPEISSEAAGAKKCLYCGNQYRDEKEQCPTCGGRRFDEPSESPISQEEYNKLMKWILGPKPSKAVPLPPLRVLQPEYQEGRWDWVAEAIVCIGLGLLVLIPIFVILQTLFEGWTLRMIP